MKKILYRERRTRQIFFRTRGRPDLLVLRTINKWYLNFFSPGLALIYFLPDPSSCCATAPKFDRFVIWVSRCVPPSWLNIPGEHLSPPAGPRQLGCNCNWGNHLSFFTRWNGECGTGDTCMPVITYLCHILIWRSVGWDILYQILTN